MFSNNGQLHIPVSGGTSWVRVPEGSKYSSQERWTDGKLYAPLSEVNRPVYSAPIISNNIYVSQAPTTYNSTSLYVDGLGNSTPESRMNYYIREKQKAEEEKKQQKIAYANAIRASQSQSQYNLMPGIYATGGVEAVRNEYHRLYQAGGWNAYSEAAWNYLGAKEKEEAPIREETTKSANNYYNEGGIENLKYLINHYKSRGDFKYASVAQSVLNAKEKEEAINTPAVTKSANEYYETGGMEGLKHLVKYYEENNYSVNANIAKRILKQKEEQEREEEHNRRMQQDLEYAENYKIKEAGNEIGKLEKEIDEQKKINPFYGQPSSSTLNERIKAFEYTKGLSYEGAKAYLDELKLPKNARFENSKIGADVALKYYFDKVIPLQNKIEQAKAKIQKIENVRIERNQFHKLIMESPLEEVVKKTDEVNSPRRMLKLYDAINAKAKKLTELGDVQAKDWENLAKQAQEKHQAINKPSVSIEILEPNNVSSFGHARIGVYTTDGKFEYYGFGSDFPLSEDSTNLNVVLNNIPHNHKVMMENTPEELGRKAITKKIELSQEQFAKLLETIREGQLYGADYSPDGFNCKSWINYALEKAGLNTTVNEQISEEEMKELIGDKKGLLFRKFGN